MFLKEKISSMAAMSLQIGMRIVHHPSCLRVVLNAVVLTTCTNRNHALLSVYQPKLVHEIVNHARNTKT